MSQRYLIIDFEVRSENDVTEVGAFEHATHPSTEIIWASWRIGTRETLRTAPVHNWSPWINKAPPIFLIGGLLDKNIILVAQNALYEKMIIRYVLSKHDDRLKNIPDERWICTAATAAAIALPRKLEEACKALNLEHQKDAEGHRLMLKLTKPRKPTKNNPSKWHNKLSELKRVGLYCSRDIYAETDLFLTVPPLSANERKVWLLDQKINQRGLSVDRDLVNKSLLAVRKRQSEMQDELPGLTNGVVRTANELANITSFLNSEGVHLENLQAKTIAEALPTITNERVKRILEIRQALGRSSTSKYEAFERGSRTDGRLRDHLMYHGASTGRWTGKGVQLHNLPRGSVDNIDVAIDLILSDNLEALELLWPSVSDVFVSAIRGCIKATEGKEIFCADFNAIEARVLAWLAGDKDGLEAWASRDPYREMAAIIYGIHVEDVTPEQREVGKRAILGCGYGMGWMKFGETCKQYALEVSEALAKKAVYAYRDARKPVTEMWRNIEQAAIKAVKRPGKEFDVNKVRFQMTNLTNNPDRPILWCYLPSGRRLAYYGPKIKYESKWVDSDPRPTLYHWDVHPKTKKWVFNGTYGGKLTENIVQAVARDLMVEGMLRLEDKDYENLLSVHDEIVSERELCKGTVKDFEESMSELPRWAKGLPLKVKGWSGPRYRKG